jgi:hypothetical protein
MIHFICFFREVIEGLKTFKSIFLGGPQTPDLMAHLKMSYPLSHTVDTKLKRKKRYNRSNFSRSVNNINISSSKFMVK